jgi:hypothetical protein
MYSEAAASDVMRPRRYEAGLLCGIAVAAYRSHEGGWYCNHVFSFLCLFVRGFRLFESILFFLVFFFITFLIIPWSLDHSVNILPANEIEGQQLLGLSKKIES